MKPVNFEKLCIKEISNNITEIEKVELLSLIGRSESYKREYENIKKVWQATSPGALEYNLNIEDEWENLTKETTMSTKTKNKKNILGEFFEGIFTPKLKPVFVFGSVLLIVIASLVIFNSADKEKILKTISTTNSQTMKVVLSDGSVVQLNNGSKIEFVEDFEEEKREIRLTGEAFFEVNKDGRPFIINTENAVTKVLGTKFNVWSRNNETRVIVKEGKVSLAENTVEDKKVFLTEGETSKVIASKSPADPTKVNTDKLLGWMDGKMVFENTSLSEITNEIERHYDIKITLENLELSKYNLTGTFDNEEIDTVLTKICLALNIKYLEGRNSYKLTK